MKPVTRNDTMVALAGYPVRVSQVRDMIVSEAGRIVILENGMKLKISKEDGELLQRVLTARKDQIINESRKVGRI